MSGGVDAALGALRQRWAGFWPQADGAAMAADVRARLAAAVAAWELEDVAPIGDGNIALVVAARRAGVPVVLKLTPRGHEDDDQLAAEGLALAHWQRTGAVPTLHDRRDGGFTLLLERVAPGDVLDAAGLSWTARLTALARLVARLHAAGPAPDGVVAMAHYARGWRRDLARDPALVAELAALCAPSPGDVLLHCDLHGANALRHGDGWRVVDPHAVRGDPHADCWALLDPLVPAAAAASAHRWVALYAAEAGLDAARVGRWAKLRARAEAWRIDDAAAADADDRAWAMRLHAFADALSRWP